MNDPAKLLARLTCRECKTALTITEHRLENGYGSADATCPQCGGQWRYIITPATGWIRAVDLNKYHVNQRERQNVAICTNCNLAPVFFGGLCKECATE